MIEMVRNRIIWEPEQSADMQVIFFLVKITIFKKNSTKCSLIALLLRKYNREIFFLFTFTFMQILISLRIMKRLF